MSGLSGAGIIPSSKSPHGTTEGGVKFGKL